MTQNIVIDGITIMTDGQPVLQNELVHSGTVNGKGLVLYARCVGPRHGLWRDCVYDHRSFSGRTQQPKQASFLALDVLPQQAFANIMQLRNLYPAVYGP